MELDSNPDVNEPEALLCPITQVMFQDPVVNKYGHTYEREALKRALDNRLCDPLTNLPLPHPDGGPVFANRAIRNQVDEFLEQNRSYVPQGWVDRVRTVVTEDARHEEEAAEIEQLQVWAIRRSSPLQDFCLQVRRFIAGFMFRPRALLPGLHDSPSKVARILGMCMGVWLGDELALLGAHIGWSFVFGVLRIVAGDTSPVVDFRFAVVAAIRTALRGSCASTGFSRLVHRLNRRKASGLMFGQSLFGNKAIFLDSCSNDIADLQAIALLQKQAARQHPDGSLQSFLTMRRAVLLSVVNVACWHVDLAGIEIGYKTACSTYDASRSAPKAILSSCWACTRLGLIAGCSYALSALYANAALAMLATACFAL